MYTNTTASTTNNYALHSLKKQAHHRPIRKASSKKQSIQIVDDLENLEPIESWGLDDFSDLLPGAY